MEASRGLRSPELGRGRATQYALRPLASALLQDRAVDNGHLSSASSRWLAILLQTEFVHHRKVVLPWEELPPCLILDSRAHCISHDVAHYPTASGFSEYP